MSQKTVPFKTPKALNKPADDWIGQGRDVTTPDNKQPVGPTKRLTVDIAQDLHRRIKVHCAETETQIADVVREMLDKAFPAVKS